MFEAERPSADANVGKVGVLDYVAVLLKIRPAETASQDSVAMILSLTKRELREGSNSGIVNRSPGRIDVRHNSIGEFADKLVHTESAAVQGDVPGGRGGGAAHI
eukprot:GHVU01146781.1.p1 GENE.GHVU01146781.1~~GHVU01146781.1.p1  ORF type:complete len:104 (+),score=13.09 GHVU01146781.1:233-544(+)